MSRKMFVYGVLAGVALCGSISFAVAQADQPEFGTARGHWELFGGWKTDEYHEPRAGDAKLVVTVDGALGQKIFNYLGPKSADADACGGLNVRSRNEVECLRIPEWKTIQCYFGFDLSTGRYEIPINC